MYRDPDPPFLEAPLAVTLRPCAPARGHDRHWHRGRRHLPRAGAQPGRCGAGGIEVVAAVGAATPARAAERGQGRGSDGRPHAGRHAPRCGRAGRGRGGTGPTRDWALAAIAHGKRGHGQQGAAGRARQRDLSSRAPGTGGRISMRAGGGEHPIIKALREGLTANRIEWVAVSSTAPPTSSRQDARGLDFDEALAQAQALACRGRPDVRHRGHGRRAQARAALANAFGMRVDFADAQVASRCIAWTWPAPSAGLPHRCWPWRGGATTTGELRAARAAACHTFAGAVNGSMNGIGWSAGDAAGVTLVPRRGRGSEQTPQP